MIALPHPPDCTLCDLHEQCKSRCIPTRMAGIAKARPARRGHVHHIDGNPHNNDPDNLEVRRE